MGCVPAMNVTYATHSPPKGGAFQQIIHSNYEYQEQEQARSDGSYNKEITNMSESASQHISPNGIHKKYTAYESTRERSYQEYEYEYYTNSDGDRKTITRVLRKDTATNYTFGGTTTMSFATEVSGDTMYLLNTIFRGSDGGGSERDESWHAYSRETYSTEIQKNITRTEEANDIPIRGVSGGRLGMVMGDGTMYTRTQIPYEYTRMGSRGHLTQGNTNQAWGTYEYGGGKYLVWRGANADHSENLQVFAKKIVVENITDIAYTGKNANALGEEGASHIFVSRAQASNLDTTATGLTRATQEVTEEAGIITGTMNKTVLSERQIETASDYNLRTYIAGELPTIFKGGVISYEARSLEDIRNVNIWRAEQQVDNAVITRAWGLDEVGTTQHMIFGSSSESVAKNTGRPIGTFGYTSFSISRIRQNQEAYSTTYQTNTDRIARELQYKYAQSDYKWTEMVEVVQEHEHGGFVSGTDSQKEYFSMNLQGEMLPAIVGKSNNYINSISTAVGMGMGAYLYDFSRTKPAKKFATRKVTNYEITKGTFETTAHTNVAPYTTKAVITFHNYSTLIDYTNRSIRANKNTNLLGLPTVFYSAHITTNENNISQVESCKYLVEGRSIESKAKRGVVATANCDDEQLFNYKNKICGDITVSSVSVTLSQGVVKNYQMEKKNLKKFTYTKAGDTFENREGFNVTVNNGVKEGEKKTIYFSPIAQPFTYYMATTTTENDGHVLLGTKPDWYTTKFENTQTLDPENHFSIMPYLPTSQILVDETTIYGNYGQTMPDVIGTTHFKTYGINYDRPYFQLMDQGEYANTHLYQSKVLSYCFEDYTRF